MKLRLNKKQYFIILLVLAILFLFYSNQQRIEAFVEKEHPTLRKSPTIGGGSTPVPVGDSGETAVTTEGGKVTHYFNKEGQIVGATVAGGPGPAPTPIPRPMPIQTDSQQNILTCPNGMPSGGFPCCPDGSPSNKGRCTNN